MRGIKRIAPALALLAGSAVGDAQCRLCTQATTAPAPVGVQSGGDVELQVETNLNFDRLVLSGSGSGSVTIRPDGSSGVEGSIIEAGPRAMVGTVLVHGDPNRPLRVDMPRRVELFSVSGGRMTLDDIRSDLPAMPRLDAAGNLSFRFGGRLVLAAGADGPFRGDIPITVDYQ